MKAGSFAEAVNFCPANWKSLSLRSKILPRVRPCEVFQLTRSPTDKSVMVVTLRRGAGVMRSLDNDEVDTLERARASPNARWQVHAAYGIRRQ